MQAAIQNTLWWLAYTEGGSWVGSLSWKTRTITCQRLKEISCYSLPGMLLITLWRVCVMWKLSLGICKWFAENIFCLQILVGCSALQVTCCYAFAWATYICYLHSTLYITEIKQKRACLEELFIIDWFVNMVNVALVKSAIFESFV